MKIALVAPLIESVPPKLYGGTERVVSFLAEELVAAGHQVTLFASGDSVTSAELVPCSSCAIRLAPERYDPVFQYMCLLDELYRQSDRFDIIHFHIDVLHFPLFRPIAHRTLTTLHGRQDLITLTPVYKRFPQFPLVSISNDQRRPIPYANFIATVYHGLPLDLFRPVVEPHGRYLAFLGRISPEKGLERAIDIALGAGLPLRIAAKIDPVDTAYFAHAIAPLLSAPEIDFIGEIGESEKQEFLGNAAAVLFPIDWPEPFGLVLIEAMACGTPVLAFRRGSVPEVVDDQTGAIVESVDEAVAILPQVMKLDRAMVRMRFEQRFSAARMAADYVRLYAQTMKSDRPTFEIVSHDARR
jgi:glycosyltransferase involved in cell wall biosynthesis